MSVAIEQTAIQWFKDEVRQASEHDPSDPKPAPPKLQLGPGKWVLPKLLRITEQNTEQPIQVLAPLIRAMLIEQAFATTGGDPCDCDRLEASIDHTVAALIRVLERARLAQLACSKDAPELPIRGIPAPLLQPNETARV